MNKPRTNETTFAKGRRKFSRRRARARAGSVDHDRDATSLRARPEIMPLELMLRIVSDEMAPLPLRADMAKAAAPYMHHRLSPVEIGGADRPAKCSLDLSKLTDEELVQLERIVAKSQITTPAKVWSPFEGDD